MAEFEESYFEGEIREGFYVEPMMKRAWAAQIEVLEEIGRICDGHGLRYFADGGTLLGAIRHKGFIPWDDDVDIAMPREDFEKFIGVAEKELPEECVIAEARRCAEWRSSIPRIVNGHEIGHCDEAHMRRYHGCPYMVGVDIFPLDYLPKSEVELAAQRELLILLRAQREALVRGGEAGEEVEQTFEMIKELFQAEIVSDRKLVNRIQQLMDIVSRMYEKEENDEVTNLAWYIDHTNYRMRREWYKESILMPFENIMIPVPVHYDEILKVTYGSDYMIPVKNIQAHDYPFYAWQQDMWENNQAKQVLMAVLGVGIDEIEEREAPDWAEHKEHVIFLSCRGTGYMICIPSEEKRQMAGQKESAHDQNGIKEYGEWEEIFVDSDKGYRVARYQL